MMRGYRRGFGGFGATPPGQSIAAEAYASVPAPNVDVDRYLLGRRMFYTYQVPNIASIAAASTQTQTIQFDLDSIFVWSRTVFFADLAGAAQLVSTQVLPLVTVQITDTATGSNFFNAPVPIGSIAGTAQLPFVMPTQQMIQPSATLSFAYNNFSAATTYTNLRLQLLGFKVYGTQPPAQYGT